MQKSPNGDHCIGGGQGAIHDALLSQAIAQRNNKQAS
jgi:hypothetical protein